MERNPTDLSLNYTPAFSAWRRRIDPALAAEDTNAIFQAFRERRLRTWAAHPTLSTLGRILGSLEMRWIVLPALSLVGVGASWKLLGPLAALIFLVGLILFFKVEKRGIQIGNRVRLILLDREAIPPLISDLWLSGADGRDFLEAVYLESSEDSIPSITVFLASTFYALNAAAVFRVSRIGNLSTWVFLFCLAAVFWGIYRYYLYTLSSAIRMAEASDFLCRMGWSKRRQKRFMASTIPGPRGWRYGILEALSLVVIVVFLLVDLSVSVAVLVLGYQMQWLWETPGDAFPFPWFGSIVCILIAAFVWVFGTKGRREHIPDLKRLFEEGRSVFRVLLEVKMSHAGKR